LEESLRLFNELTPARALLGGVNSGNFPVDIIEKTDHFLVSAELAGIPKEKIDLKIDESSHSVIISAEKEESYEMDKADWKRRGERSFGRIQRVIQLPPGADVENTVATNKDGVLCLKIPKREQKVVKLVIR